MHSQKSSVTVSSPVEEFPAPSHPHRIVESCRDDDSSTGRITGADMSNIFRAYSGRLNLSYWRLEDNQKVCEDAMELLDEIVIWHGCEPTVIISYVALVREVYSHACVNLKQMKISEERRRSEMLEQWKQIERHFLRVKDVMSNCWPIGNETDLLTVYLSIALLYSLYKDVCDEEVIVGCYEAAQRARRCGAYKLSKNEFAEVQQYCDTIENIFFLRNQRVTNGRSHFIDEPLADERTVRHMGGPPPERAPYRRLPNGKAILAEYAASNRTRQNNCQNGHIFVETTTVTVETFETRTICEEPIRDSGTQLERPKRLSGAVGDRKVLVENYAEIRLSDEKPPSLKQGLFNLHNASVEARDAQQALNTKTSMCSFNQSSPSSIQFSTSAFPVSPPASAPAAFASAFVTASHVEDTPPYPSASPEAPLPKTADLLPPVAVSQQLPHFLTDSSVHASLRHSAADLTVKSTTVCSPLVQENVPSGVPEVQSPSPPPSHSPTPLSPSHHPHLEFSGSSTTTILPVGPPPIPLVTPSPTFIATTATMPDAIRTATISLPTVPCVTTTHSSLPPTSPSPPSSTFSASTSSALSIPTRPPTPPPIIASSNVSDEATTIFDTSAVPSADSPASETARSPTLSPSSSKQVSYTNPPVVPHLPSETTSLSLSTVPVLTPPSAAVSFPPRPKITQSPTLSPCSSPHPVPASSVVPAAASLSPCKQSSTASISEPTPITPTDAPVSSTPPLAILPSVTSASLFTAESSAEPLPQKTATALSPHRPSAPPPPPPLPAHSGLSVASACSNSVTSIVSAAADPLSPASIASPSHPSPPRPSGSPTARPPVPPPPPPSAVSLISLPQSTTPLPIPPSPHSPLFLSLQNSPTALSPHSPVFASTITAQPISVVTPEKVTPQYETSACSPTPFRSPVSARRPLHHPISSTPLVVSLHGSTSVDTDELLRNFRRTSEMVEQRAARTLSANSADLSLPKTAKETAKLLETIQKQEISSSTEGSAKQPADAESVESMNTGKVSTESFEVKSSSKALHSTSTASEPHQEMVAHPESLALKAEVKEIAADEEIEVDAEESMYEDEPEADQDEMLSSLKDANLTLLSQLLNDHEMSANEEELREQYSRHQLTKRTLGLDDTLKENGCDSSLVSELATSWIARKQDDQSNMGQKKTICEPESVSGKNSDAQFRQASADYGIQTTGVNLPNEIAEVAMTTEEGGVKRKAQRNVSSEMVEMFNGNEAIDSEYSTDNKISPTIGVEDPFFKQLHADNANNLVNIAPNSTVYRIPTYSIFDSQYDNFATFNSEFENAGAVSKSESAESDKQSESYNAQKDSVDTMRIQKDEATGNTADSDLICFSDLVRNGVFTRQYKSEEQSSLDARPHQRGATARSSSLMAELKSGLITEGNDDNAGNISPVLEHVKWASGTLYSLQENADAEDAEYGEEESGRNEEQLQYGSTEGRESAEDENQLKADDVARISTGFIPMHEEIITARSTLRHVTNVPKEISSDTPEAAFDTALSSTPSVFSRPGSIFDNPIVTATRIGSSSTTGAEDGDDSTATPMTFFDPRLEFERRIKLKKKSKPSTDLPVIVKDTNQGEASLKRFSGLWSSRHVSSGSEQKAPDAGIRQQSDPDKQRKSPDAADPQGYYDTVNC
ncbi:hypothetical protein Tcan_18861 [Toxocara canis]|uniref:Uncharacterized protein n=1 Tax=Toxocara canis TaxID=6265 RepID=A0A0B2W144_TOXCA|nr:hypothetical protein Tcan_18861 [Toxocara canis]